MTTQTDNINDIEWNIDRTPTDFRLFVHTNTNAYLPTTVDEFLYPYTEDEFVNHYAEFARRIRNGAIAFATHFEDELNDDFIPFKKPIQKPIESVIQEISMTEEDKICCICYETKKSEDISQVNCSHKFCSTCIIEHISKNSENSCCPLCREKITNITFQHQKYQDILIKFHRS